MRCSGWRSRAYGSSRRRRRRRCARRAMRRRDISMIRTVVLASSNAGKLREFTRLLEPLGIEVIPQARLGIAEAEEPHITFVENALAKARHASAQAHLPALAD